MENRQQQIDSKTVPIAVVSWQKPLCNTTYINYFFSRGWFSWSGQFLQTSRVLLFAVMYVKIKFVCLSI